MTAVSVQAFSFIQQLVYKRAAIVLEPGKEYLVASRLTDVVRDAGVQSLDELVERLRSSGKGALENRVVEAMTTNETSFFRDIHPFEALRTTVLPELYKARAATKQLRIWCAAASTGQEPYTIAMVVKETLPPLERWDVQILATDINASVLARARTGVFKQLEVNRGLPAAMLIKYFERHGADWAVKREIRDYVRFHELNLLDSWAMVGPQDLVFMRNVLIYFDVPTKTTILGRIKNVLRPDGALFLGGAETTLRLDDDFAPTRHGPTVVFRKRSPSR